MANEQNLRPAEYKLSQEEAKKGGINSGKARRKKKTLKQIGDMIGSLDIKSPKTKTLMRNAGILDDDMINDVEMMFNLQRKAKKGDAKSIELLAKLRGQYKELQQTEVIAPKPLVDLTERKKNGQAEGS